MPKGKNISLFLMDGEATGRIKCTLANWTGVVYKIPRTTLDKCKERADLKQSGVYFLFGTSEVTGNKIVYIGQAGARKNGEGLLYRIMEHKRNLDKDYWTEAVIFTTSNNSFGPTEISYLENYFCSLALAAQRYVVKNSNQPNPGNITEEKESELEEFASYARIIMGTLGYKVFEPLTASPEQHSELGTEQKLYFKRSYIQAIGYRTHDGFVVLKGSQIAATLTKSCPPNVLKYRQQYASKIDENYILTDDLFFSSPSATASFVGGASLSGNVMWQTAAGLSLKDLD